MAITASALILTAIAVPAPTDITPISLAVRPEPVERAAASYDWTRQQLRGLEGQRLATETAICDTIMSTTNINGQSDTVPDCRFD